MLQYILGPDGPLPVIGNDVYTLLDGATATGAGTSCTTVNTKRTFQASGSVSASTGAASIDIEVSNDGTNWIVLGTISLTLGTTTTSDGFVSDAPWKHVRANVDSISGTDASVDVYMGV